ncbi:MAG: hypothetical protein CME53_01835 [Halieaceae bacterium]|jgi:hypothetical protein|nr:hypothetical protein [Halieaceae bacterium]
MMKRRLRMFRTASLGVMATAALIWGAVDIVGVSFDAILGYLWQSLLGVLLLVLLSLPVGMVLGWIRRRRQD